jgi:hypothetical protein
MKAWIETDTNADAKDRNDEEIWWWKWLGMEQ